MPRRVVDPRVVALGVGVPLVVLVLVVVVLVRADGAQETTSTTTTGAAAPPAVDEVWNDDLGTAVEPLNTVLVDLAATVDAWSVGDVDDAELEALLDRAAPVVEGVRRAAESLDDHPEEPVARPLVVHMAELYVRSVEAHRLALATSDDIRTQYDRLGRRLRILADRVFDRARERTSARIDPGPDISVVLPAEVPDWERLEIAAGPPLVAADPNRPGELPRSREDDRPTQDEDAWLRDVAALDVPIAGEVRDALGDVRSLDVLAQRLVAAAETLRTVPVPDDDRGRADRVALGWLVRAEGARAAQLAALDERPETASETPLFETLLSISARAAFSHR